MIKSIAETWGNFWRRKRRRRRKGDKRKQKKGEEEEDSIIIFKGIHESDTFFTFANVDYVTGKTNIWLLRKWLYFALLFFAGQHSLWSDHNIRKSRDSGQVPFIIFSQRPPTLPKLSREPGILGMYEKEGLWVARGGRGRFCLKGSAGKKSGMDDSREHLGKTEVGA